jgi:hypothetical protein
MNADNASANDTMTTCLDDMPNAFEEVHRVRCFNHTLQLSAKALLKPFNAGLSSDPKADELLNDAGNADACLDELEDDDATSMGEELSFEDKDDDDDDELDEDQHAELMEQTAHVRTIVSKVCIAPRSG